MKGLAIVSTKGGVGKTSISHLIALGAAWKNTPAYLMHTDDREPIRVQGRPYMYYDARDPETLSRLIGAAVNQDGLCIIDSGGNRPEFDQWIASAVDMVLIPVTPDPEAVDMALEHMKRLEEYGASNVCFLLNMVSSNRNEKMRDNTKYFSRLPKNKIIGEVAKISAVKRLRENDKTNFETPPTNVNNLSRQLFFMVKGALQRFENVEESLEIA
jgi:cellulose biosynthesis protein BcsQ